MTPEIVVVLAAALISERVSILSGDHTEGGLAALTRRYPGAYCLGDEAAEMKASALTDCAINSGTDSGPAIPPDRVVAIVHTSGTTGAPRAAGADRPPRAPLTMQKPHADHRHAEQGRDRGVSVHDPSQRVGAPEVEPVDVLA